MLTTLRSNPTIMAKALDRSVLGNAGYWSALYIGMHDVSSTDVCNSIAASFAKGSPQIS